MQSYIDAYLRLFRNYANFNGRDTRSQYWKACLVDFLIQILLLIIPFVVLFFIVERIDIIIDGTSSVTIIVATILPFFIYNLALFLPRLAISFRRLHDIGKSGWWWLLGPKVLLIWTTQPSQEGENDYGPNPLDSTEN